MDLRPLAELRNRVRYGAALAFHIRHPDGTLLLARGQTMRDEAQFDALVARGAVVDLDDHATAAASRICAVRDARAEQLPAMWVRCMSRVGHLLRESPQTSFTDALDEASKPVLALIARDPDLAIFQMVQQVEGGKQNYGVAHSIHAAITCHLVAARLGWDEAAALRAFKAALTMNMGMIELQGRLANQVTPVTATQRAAIHAHPQRSVEILEAAGIADRDWLEAIARHHELPDGSGYPHGLRETGELAALLRHADVYTAMLSTRINRPALPANHAARRMFLRDQGDPMILALVKEFGIYPPGCYVRLASGEIGVVVKRGPQANAPIVAALMDRRGDALMEPVRRQTAAAEHAIVDVVDEKKVRVRVAAERLSVLARG
jgi:HD-GYP domain-containing protein (c-di-GMP phosphodiesterase class II)